MVKPWAESVLLSSAGIVVGREGRQSEWGVFPAGSFWLGAQALECPPPSARPASPPQPPPPPQKQLLRNTAPPRPAALLPNVRLFPTAPPPEDRPQGLASGLAPSCALSPRTLGALGASTHTWTGKGLCQRAPSEKGPQRALCWKSTLKAEGAPFENAVLLL